MIRIVDNKKVEMTNDEYALYEKIVKAYTSETNKGEDFFYDLFESDDNRNYCVFKATFNKKN